MSEKKEPLFKVVTAKTAKSETEERHENGSVVTTITKKPEFVPKPNISNSEIQDVLTEGAAKNRQGKLVLIAGIILAVIGVFSASGANVFFLFGGIIIAAFGFTMTHRAKSFVKMNAGVHVIQSAMEEVFEQVNYQPNKSIDIQEIRSTKMGFPFSFNSVESDDDITAVYHGLSVHLNDVKLVNVTTSTDQDGDEHEHRETVFQGLWIVCDFGKELSADLILAEGRRFRKEGIKTDNDRFNRKFGILASNPHDVFYILTPHMMDYIMDMDRRCEGDTYMNFSRDGKLHIAINTGHPSFEVTSFNMSAEDLRSKFVDEVRYVTDLIDELRLVDTMYKQ